MPDRDESSIATGLDLERRFVLALGGFAHEIAGATLVTFERVPSEPFNFGDIGPVSPLRLTALVERSLDHYFQRAIRPVFRVAEPVPAGLDAALRRVGFRRDGAGLRVLVSSPRAARPRASGLVVRRASHDELDTLVSLWAPPRERLELRAAIDNAWCHPNPAEELVPFLATRGETPVGAAMVYVFGRSRALVLTAAGPGRPSAAGASALVSTALRDDPGRPLWTVAPARPGDPDPPDGFRVVGTLRRYRLSPAAELDLGPIPPAGPPRWRPPR